jgi:hypothetical protein
MDREQAADDLRRLFGLPPHNTWTNHCCADYVFAQYIEKEYCMSVDELAKLLNIKRPDNATLGNS